MKNIEIKIAGKPDTTPLINGRPSPAIHTDNPIALPAATPLIMIEKKLTELEPDGASPPFETAKNPKINANNTAINPI